MNAVESFILNQAKENRELLLYFHNLLVSKYQLIPSIKYAIPFYSKNRWICYLNPLKSGGIELAFTRAREFPTSFPILEARGRKQIQGLVLKPNDTIPLEIIEKIVEAALALDSISKK